jgi:hypothetical protein
VGSSTEIVRLHTPNQDQTHLQQELELSLNHFLIAIVKQLSTVAYWSKLMISAVQSVETGDTVRTAL